MSACGALLGQPRPQRRPGAASMVFRRSGTKTVLATALSASPLRLLMPDNHGDAAWVTLSSFGGGLVDGDSLDIEIEVGRGAFALVGTQASTKVYRSPSGCAQRVVARVSEGAALAIVPDPVVCYAGAHYEQELRFELAPSASLVVLDGYTCGRRACGERWSFGRYASRSIVSRMGTIIFVDATELDPSHGEIASRMRGFDSIASMAAFGPRFRSVASAMLACGRAPARGDSVLVASSPVSGDGAVVRVAAPHVEDASRELRSCFRALAHALGDDPFARKW